MPFGGIASTEKVASDGSVKIGAWTCGIFDLMSDLGAIVAGDFVTISGANTIREATEADLQAGRGVGKALETVAAGTAERIQVAVGLY